MTDWGRAQHGKALKPPHEDHGGLDRGRARRAVGSARAITLADQSKAAMRITTYAFGVDAVVFTKARELKTMNPNFVRT